MEATDDTAARGTTVVRYFLPAEVAVDEILMVVCYAERVMMFVYLPYYLYVGKNRKSVKIDDLISANSIRSLKNRSDL